MCEVAYLCEKILLISCMLPPNGVSALSIIVCLVWFTMSSTNSAAYLQLSKVRRRVNYIKVSNLLKTVVSLGGSWFRNFAKKKYMKKPLKTCSMNWGEVNPVHVYYIIWLQVKKSSQAEVQDEDKERQLSSSSALEELMKTFLYLFLYL